MSVVTTGARFFIALLSSTGGLISGLTGSGMTGSKVSMMTIDSSPKAIPFSVEKEKAARSSAQKATPPRIEILVAEL